jgi:hypothetical protein
MMYGGRSFRAWQFAMLISSLALLILQLTRTEWSSIKTNKNNTVDHVIITAPQNNNKKKRYRGWVMMHTLKAGGTSVEKLLNKVGYRQPSNNSLYQKGRIGGYVYFEQNEDDSKHNATAVANSNRLWYNAYMSRWKDGKDAYFSALPRDEFFKIGMVREPCDYMVSIWAYSAQGRHGFLTGRCAGSESKNNFTQFLHESILPFPFGWLSYRVALQLGAAGREKIGAQTCPSQASAQTISRIEALIANNNNNVNAITKAADCWVRTENMRSDLHRCLQLYVKMRNGATSMTMDNFPLQQPAHQFNRGKHKPCSEHYSNRDASAVWQREGKLAQQFGYSGCCQGLVDPRPI